MLAELVGEPRSKRKRALNMVPGSHRGTDIEDNDSSPNYRIHPSHHQVSGGDEDANGQVQAGNEAPKMPQSRGDASARLFNSACDT